MSQLSSSSVWSLRDPKSVQAQEQRLRRCSPVLHLLRSKQDIYTTLQHTCSPHSGIRSIKLCRVSALASFWRNLLLEKQQKSLSLCLGTPLDEFCTAEYVNIQAFLFASMNSTIARESRLTWQRFLRVFRITADSDASRAKFIASQRRLPDYLCMNT